MFVAFMHGPVASGKYTIATQLSALTGLPLFHNHIAVDAALALFQFGSASFKSMRAQIWLTAFTEAAESGLSFIFTFCPESTVDPTLINELTQSVTSRGGQVVFVELCCSKRAIRSRLANESRTKLKKLVDPEVFDKIDSDGGFDFARLPDPILSIDTEEISAEAAAALIARELSSFQ